MNKQIIFGTDGIRGNADTFPFCSEGLTRIGRAIGLWALEKYKVARPKIMIGMDTRESGDRIKKELIAALVRFPLDVVDVGILPTPAVSQLVCKRSDFNCGIVISASHNPYQDNGIKLFDGVSCKLSLLDEQCLLNFANNSFESDQNQLGGVCTWDGAASLYQDYVEPFFKADFLQGLTIVLDCAHGATSFLAPQIFEYFGASVISITAQPNGKNINDGCGALHPEIAQAEVLKSKASIGFAFDGDGDRVICISKDGRIKDGDDILMILAQHKNYRDSSEIVGTVMSNSGFEDILNAQGKSLSRTSVGDKYVAAMLEEKGLLLGGEASGHVVARDYLATGDGIFVALRLLEVIIETNNWQLTTFEKKPQVLLNVKTKSRDDLSKEHYKKIIDEHFLQLEKGRILVRFSGTEDVLRVMVEDVALLNTEKIARNLADALVDALGYSQDTAGVCK